ncbi:MAG: hypothetical protein ACOYN5_15565 [Bacteroidales bacterium]
MKNNNWKDTLTKDASLEELVVMMSGFSRHLLKDYLKLLLIPLVFGSLAVLIGFMMSETKQKAVYIIAAEEESSSGFEGLMAQFGLDVGGSNPGGVFKGENLVHLFQTRSMIERALLNEIPYKGGSVICADLFFRSTNHAKKSTFKNVQFKTDRKQQDALTDSALFLTYEYVQQKVLDVSKPDKKMGFIYVACIHRDPLLAVAFSKVLISTVTDFYVESLTKKARMNLDVLRSETDSVRTVLASNLYSSAQETDLNINPLRQVMRVSQNRSMIDLQISISLYGELIKNLKLAELSLRKQTPLIQIIEEPKYPLLKVGYKAWQIGFAGFASGLLLALYLSFRSFTHKQDI